MTKKDVPLFQEALFREPFWMLVACQLVNRTSWAKACGVLDEIRRRWPTVRSMASAWPDLLEDVVTPLGLQTRRTRGLIFMAQAWLECQPASSADVFFLPGCGRYASDSWAIFVDGRRDVDVTDKRLRQFLDRS